MASTLGGGGMFADFARKPPGYKVAVFAAIGAALGLLYWQFVLGPLRKERNQLASTHSSLEAESQRLDNELTEYDRLKTRYAQLDRIIAANQKALPTGSELPAFFETLNRRVGEAGVEVKKWEYKKEVPVETFIKVPLAIEMTGTFHQIKRFFASLVQHGVATEPGEVGDGERIITIENLTLSIPKQKSRDLLLTAQFTASTFRQEQAAPPDEGKPAPSRKTPPTAKGKADAALRRSESRAADTSSTEPTDGTTPRDR